MKLIILGNGKSRELYNESDYSHDKIVIGCNLPMEGVRHDYIACVDSKAVMTFFRPVKDSHYHRIEEEGFRFILGPRCVNGLRRVKSQPASKDTMLDHFKAHGLIFRTIDVYPDALEIGQRYFSSGHMAFTFALDEWGSDIDEIHFFGFDSFFSGYHDSYTSDIIVGTDTAKLMSKDRLKFDKDNPSNSAGAWYWIWEKLLKYRIDDYSKIIIHGYEDSDIPDAFKNLKVEVANRKKEI